MILGIYGAGGSGKMAVDLAVRINEQRRSWDEIIFIDDTVGVDMVYGTKVLSFSQTLEVYESTEIEIIITLGDPALREKIYRRVKDKGYHLATIIDPNANVSPSAKIGEGTVVCNAFIGSDVEIGDNSVVYEHACIGHDTKVGNHNIVSAMSFIAGHCIIKNNIFIGPSSSIRDNIVVEDNAIVSLGAAVYRNVAEHHTAIGNPAKCVEHEKKNPLF